VYQLMVEYNGGNGDRYMVSSGRLSTKLKMLKNRLAKHHRGWIVKLGVGGKGKIVVVARGFSRNAMKAIQSVGVEVV